ncbi:MAG: DUF4037 domain-containing protein [Pyrinomonadaceae bacterium]
MSRFIPGKELSRRFFFEAVKPILTAHFGRLQYGAALIGPGSEVLNFDTEMSSDHCWGPRLILFLRESEIELSQTIDKAFRTNLPATFLSYPTGKSAPDPEDNGTWHLESNDEEVNHAVQIVSLRKYLLDYVGFDIDQPLEAIDWLTFPEQKLRTLRDGEVYHDSIGLRKSLDQFHYYPNDVWLYLLSAGWNRIGQEEHLFGRAGSVGDNVGASIIASRLVRDLMRLCFLMAKEYAPYPKWLGTAFSKLKCAPELLPTFSKVLIARNWQEGEENLVKAYLIVAEMHNDLGITPHINVEIGDFFGRPFKVVHLPGKYSEAIANRIEDKQLKRLALTLPLGNIDQISDNTDLLSTSAYRKLLRQLYD